MTERAEHIAALLQKLLKEELTLSEKEALQQWLDQSESHRKLFGEINNEDVASADLLAMQRYDVGSIAEKIQAVLPDVQLHTPTIIKHVNFWQRGWIKYAAAILIIINGVAVYYNFLHTSQTGNGVAQTTPPPIPNDVLPGFNRAVLTLSDGKKVTLDSNAVKTIQDGTVAIENNNGQLHYLPSQVMAMNTMTTPKGGQYQLVLPDGSRVWLNAASSITYPTAFTGDTREVTMTGEAYFEVAKNKEKPFMVRTLQETIEVVGTHFNVNAYAEEASMKTSLLEGSVKIGTMMLKPGQGFQNGKIIRTNVQQDVAWKNGAFDFDDLDFAACMRQLERWYDIQVVYDGAVPQDKFLGQIDRNLTLREVLEGLSGVVAQFRLEGRTLHVLP